MCDMRGAPTHALVKATNETISVPYISADFNWALLRGVTSDSNNVNSIGIYHVGASGCGYVHYDGDSVLNLDSVGEWENDTYKYSSDGSSKNLNQMGITAYWDKNTKVWNKTVEGLL